MRKDERPAVVTPGTSARQQYRVRSSSGLSADASSSSMSAAPSSGATAASYRRLRPGLNPLSPLSRHTFAPNSSSSRSIAPSVVSTSSRNISRPFLSSGASNAGSTYTSMTTTTQLTRATNKRGGHSRRKAVATQPARTDNPDDFDLNALEDADEVFRLYHVKDVQTLERRARAAANAKVSELRAMVGERYRDLLSAADSIVRMRDAAEKMADKLETVQHSITSVGAPSTSTPNKHAIKSGTQTPTADNASLGSTPALSLSIQLLLTIPSAVHHLVDSASYLAAARLEAIGRQIYSRLQELQNQEDDDFQAIHMFPIVNKQYEAIHNLNALIRRRTMQDLRNVSLSSPSIAEALAAIMLLDGVSVPNVLDAFLKLRSEAMSDLLDVNFGSRHQEASTIAALVDKVILLAVSTVTAVKEVFATDTDGLLPIVIAKLQSPTKADDVAHPLTNLPNYTLLQRHLPASVINFVPSLKTQDGADTRASSPERLQAWLDAESNAIVESASSWLESMQGGATAIARVRQTIRASLANGPADTRGLLDKLLKLVDDRLEQVYRAHLKKLVDRLQPSIWRVVEGVPSSKADVDPAVFLFDFDLPFPHPTHYSKTSTRHAANQLHQHDPYDLFRTRLYQHVDNRTPLIEQALSEIEAHARELRQDLLIWLQGNDDGAERLHALFVAGSEGAMDDMFTALQAIAGQVKQRTEIALFLAKFLTGLAQSKNLSSDLLLASDLAPNPKVSALQQRWTDRLYKLREDCLPSWSEHAISQALSKLDSQDYASRITARAEAPSAHLLASLRTLLAYAWQASPLRSAHGSSIDRVLLADYEDAVFEIFNAIYKSSEDSLVLEQLALDVQIVAKLRGNDRQGPLNSLDQQLASRISDAAVMDRAEATSIDFLRRTQTIWAPFVAPLSTKAAQAPAAGLSRLLPLGAAKAQSEVKPVLDFVKPGPRLGLLPVRT